MLEGKEIINPSAIEEVVCEKISEAVKYPMDKEESEIMIMLFLMKADNLNIPEKEQPFLYQLIDKRIRHCFTFIINDARLILFLAMIAKSPGFAVMYLWFLQSWCFKRNIKELTLDYFFEMIFPDGFPSHDDLDKIWDAQKVRLENGIVNLVDYASAGTAIQFIEKPHTGQ